MTDVGIAYGDPGGGPPLDLPTLGLPPPPRERIRITPDTKTAKAAPKEADPWAGWTDKGPNSDQPVEPAAPMQVAPMQPGQPAQAAPAADPWAGWTDKGPNSDQEPMPEIGLGQASLMGARSGLTVGAYPWLKGMATAAVQQPLSFLELANMPEYSEAGLTPEQAAASVPTLQAREQALAPAMKVQRATTRAQQKYEEAAQEQHPLMYYGSEFLTGMAPALASGGATTEAGLGSRLIRAAVGGGAYGGASGGGTALSESKTPGEAAVQAGIGAAVGAPVGAGGAAIGEGLIKGGQYVGRIMRGARDPDTEAGRQVAGQLLADKTKFGYPVTPEMADAAKDAGLPLGMVDLGSQGTRDLARVAATSSDAWQTFSDFFGRRAGAGDRIGGFIRRITGGARAADDREALEAQRAIENSANYKAAYTAGDRAIKTPEIDTLLGDPMVVDAVKAAVRRGKSYSIDEGHGAFNPGVTVTDDGRVVFNRGPSGVPAYPNLQFWDYVQRSLATASRKYAREGDRDGARLANNFKNRLNAELDAQVPEFNTARVGASAHFKAADAYEAGQNLVGDSTMSAPEVRRHLSTMTPSERELFAKGFASKLADRFEGLRYDLKTINQAFVDSPRARQQIITALGGTRAAQLEALLRVEGLAQQSGRILGGSPTARNLAQYAGHGIGGAGAVAGVEALEHEDLNPKALLVGALMGGAMRGYARHVDARIANRIAEMLTSDDPSVLAAGARSLVRDRTMFNNLRAATRTGALTPAMFGARHPAGTVAVGGAMMEPKEGESAGSENDPYFGTYYGTEKRQ